MILPCIYPSTNETLHICNLIANEKKHSSERDTIRYFYVVRWYNHDNHDDYLLHHGHHGPETNPVRHFARE